MVVGAFGGTSTLGAFIVPMSGDLGWSTTTITSAQAIGTLLGGLSALLAGRLVDEYGTRAILAAAGILMSLSLLVCASVQEPWQFFVGYGLTRLVLQGIIQLATPTAVAQWFVRRRGRATGIVFAGSAIGVAISVPLAQHLIDTAGWRVAWAAFAALALVLLTPLAVLLLRRRPEDLGLLPDGASQPAPELSSEPDKEAPAAHEPIWNLGAALRTRTFWLLLASGALSNYMVAGMTTYQIPLLVHNGVPAPTAALNVSVYAICWLLGGVVWGFVGERLTIRYALAVTYVAAAVAAMIILHATSAGPALAFALLFGLVIGGSSNLEAVVWADYYGRVALGSIRGFGRPILMGANALAPPTAAITIDALGSYDVAYWGFAVVALMAAVLVLAAPPPRRS